MFQAPMIVRLRFPVGRRVKLASGKNRHIALAIAALMTPATLMMFVMAGWRIGSDLQLATEFPISEGVWSHWQMWGAVAFGSHVASVLLNRYGKNGKMAIGSTLARMFGSLFSKPGLKSRSNPSRAGD
jgi:hypothetical protein